MAAAKKTIDVCLFGTTGFTGRLAAAYMANRGAVRFAIAGRSATKLQQIREALPGDVEVIQADAADPETIDAMTAMSRVVMNTAGPFAKLGEPVIASCIRNGADYVDITGEAPWVAQMIEKYDEQAREKGVAIVNMCGFDSVPSDLGAYMLVDAARAADKTVNSIKASVRIRGGGLSGGTAHSAFGIASNHNKYKGFLGPMALAKPGRLPPRADGVPDSPSPATEGANDLTFPAWDPVRRAWVTTWMMGPVNSAVVRRSAALHDGLGERYSAPDTPFQYHESMEVPSMVTAYTIPLFLGATMTAMSLPICQPCVRRQLPKQGTGPSPEARAKTKFCLTLRGELVDADGASSVGVATVSGGDPGYDETSKMLSEAAILLATSRAELPVNRAGGGGFLTPATALGMPYVEALRAAGMGFAVNMTE